MEKVREGYKMTELGEIPEEWEVRKLEEISEKITDGSHFSPEPVEFSNYKICTVVNMVNNMLDLGKSACISEKDFCNLCKSGCKPEWNDVLLSKDGTVGKTLVYIYKDYKIVLLSSIAIIRPKKQIVDSFYLKHYISYPKTLQQLINMKTGSAIKRIVLRDIKGLKLAVPTVNEQQKIVSILSSIDEEIQITDNLIERTKELKKGLMQRLLTKGIGHDRFKDTEIGRIPEGWEIKRFKDISKVNQGLQIAIENRFKESGVNRLPYITIQYVNNKNNYDNQYYIENASKSVICNTDDILMTRTGNTGVVVTNEHGIFHNNFFKVDYNRYIINRDFLVYYLKSKPLQSLILRYAGTTTIPDLNHGDFYRIPVVLPLIKEQGQIASILSSVDEKIDKYESKKEKLQELKKGLMQKLLTGKIRVKL